MIFDGFLLLAIQQSCDLHKMVNLRACKLKRSSVVVCRNHISSSLAVTENSFEALEFEFLDGEGRFSFPWCLALLS